MAYAAGDVVRFTVKAAYDSQLVLNVFYYQIGALGGSSLTPADIGLNFWTKVKAAWRGIVATPVSFDRILIENLDGDLSYGEYVIPTAEQAGLATGVAMASYEAYAIKFNRTSRLVRNGAKRIVGVTETGVDAFGVLTSAYFTAVQALADVFAQDLLLGAVVVAAPVIVGFPNENRPLRVVVNIDTATAATVTTTQNTRKRGKGA